MKIFFDMEFTGLSQSATPISIGMVSEVGREFYAEFIDYDESQVDEWIQANVIDNLVYKAGENRRYTEGAHFGIEGDRVFVAGAIREWLWSFDTDLEMWGDCCAYDWVLFCQLFGGALTMIDRVHYIPMDLSTYLFVSGEDPDVNREEFSGMHSTGKHNAMHDARVTRICHGILSERTVRINRRKKK